VLELTASVQPDSGAIQICKELRKAGYWLALDDLALRQDFGPFLEYTNVLKIDFRKTPLAVRADIGRKFRGVKLLLAHNVDSKPEYEEAYSHGYGLFQGFFFCQPPQVVSNRKLSPSQVTSLRLLHATANEDLEFSEIERIIKEDPALCYRLLTFLNSAEFCLQSGVRSIRHALALLGERGIRRWVMLTGTVAASHDKPKELLRFALLRAKLAEILAPHAKCTEFEGFLVGLFSLMPAILGLDAASLLQNIDVPVTVRGALTGKEGRLTSLLQVLSYYEQGQWLECADHARGLGLDAGELSGAYLKAVQWSMSLPI
jgi:c-di-GMP-related signal transduction protein